MSHKETLLHLMPLELGPKGQADLDNEAKQLNEAEASIEQFQLETFPDTASLLISSWEKTYGLTPEPGAALADRQLQVCLKMREMGRLDKAYFISLAAALGFEIVIQELNPFMAGWSWPGLQTLEEKARWVWRVVIIDSPLAFRAGANRSGDGLGAGGPEDLRTLFNRLKPAHTFVEIAQAGANGIDYKPAFRAGKGRSGDSLGAW